jgi:hypothetical protein
MVPYLQSVIRLCGICRETADSVNTRNVSHVTPVKIFCLIIISIVSSTVVSQNNKL